MDNSIIKIEHVSMKFNLGIDKGFSFKQFFVDLLSGKRRKKKKQNIQKRRNSIMNRETSLKPVLCIDLKKNRIRIHKLTLHMLGDPEYIQLLVNPQDSMIAIRKSVRKDYLAHRVRYSKADSRYCYELYSTELLQALRHTGIYLEDNRSYRIYGALNPKECLASFSMNECVLVDDMTRTEESV